MPRRRARCWRRGAVPGAAVLAVVTDGEPEVVEFVVLLRDEGAEGAEGVLAGGVFVRGDLVGIGEATGVDGGGGVVVGVGVGVVDGIVGEVAAAVDGAEVGIDGVIDVVAAELGLAGLVEVAGGGAELFVDEVVEGFVNGNVAGAEAEAFKGAGNACPDGGALVNGDFEGKPGVVLAGGGDFGIPLAGGVLECGGLRSAAHQDGSGALNSDLLFDLVFMVFFLCSAAQSGLSPFTRKARAAGRRVGGIFGGHHALAPC